MATKILIINQPLNNRGDESAHKGLVRRMLSSIENVEITVLFWGGMPNLSDSIRQFSVKSPRVNYVIYNPSIAKGVKLLQNVGLKYNMDLLWNFHPAIRKYLEYFKASDIVVCAPGGMCMGGFQNWSHLFNLQCAKLSRKPLAYYGRSFGPFPVRTKDNRLFKKASIKLLDYFSYLSIRDNKTKMIADELGVKNYISVVDTAFLDSPHVTIPDIILKQIGDAHYFVFVPNLLIWHPAYKKTVSKEDIITFYCRMLKIIFEKKPGLIAVMLPQTFNYGTYEGDDINLFREIKNAVRFGNKVCVVDDIYSSDIQQTIISKSEFMIGARYHSVVFAINNKTPFVALNYEHKISGMLESLNLSENQIDIVEAIKTSEGRNSILNQLSLKLDSLSVNNEAYELAKKISKEGFIRFEEYVENQ